MISQLSGKLIDKQATTIVIDVNGVGYELDVPVTTLSALPALGAPVTLYTHLLVREDAHQLYGFATTADRSLFRHLIKVSGIGARTALAMLSGMDGHTLTRCVIDSDAAMLSKIPGIGKKTAERLIVEMRDKLAKGTIVEFSSVNVITSAQFDTQLAGPHQDAIHALISLGYKPVEAQKAVANVAPEETISSEELIRLALKQMI